MLPPLFDPPTQFSCFCEKFVRYLFHRQGTRQYKGANYFLSAVFAYLSIRLTQDRDWLKIQLNGHGVLSAPNVPRISDAELLAPNSFD